MELKLEGTWAKSPKRLLKDKILENGTKTDKHSIRKEILNEIFLFMKWEKTFLIIWKIK